MNSQSPHYTVLSGGVGGAKLVLGLSEILTAGQLEVIANTGDDFEHLGLPISPDIDTLLYTLAGLADPAQGWGRADETWQFMDSLEQLGGATWFRLGDKDLAIHTRRRSLLTEGLSLSAVISELRQALGVAVAVWPMSEQAVRTEIDTPEGSLAFQEYFVRRQAEPVASGFRYTGANSAHASAEALAALHRAESGAIIISPSNPWLSIDPILSVSDIKSTMQSGKAPVVAVSPIVGGKAIKGPTAKLMQEMGLKPSALAIAEHYRDIIDGLVIDTQDAEQQQAIEAMGIQVNICNTVMTKLSEKRELAKAVTQFAATLRKGQTK